MEFSFSRREPRRHAASHWLMTAIGCCLCASLSACGSTGSSGRATSGRLVIATAFYPLQWVTQQVGGARVAASSVTRAGAEPHDLELTPHDVATVLDADLVVYLRGFQAAMDDAVTKADSDKVLDVAGAARLDLRTSPADDQRSNASSVADPHFWLDPTRMADVASTVAGSLARIDPSNASTYTSNANELGAQLRTLDHEYSVGLANCRIRDLVTSHAAFGYLARHYGFDQVGIAGLSPETEPSSATMSSVSDLVRRRHVTTIYFETLTSPDVARTLAAETGASTAQLDPIEGLTAKSNGRDYLAVMRSNLATLRTSQGCP